LYQRRQSQHSDKVACRTLLRQQVIRLFNTSRQAAGSRSIVDSMQLEGIDIGRYKVRMLMKKAGLHSKQPPHKYRVCQAERVDSPNLLNREFTMQQSNQVWCGDITYIWAGHSWVYLALVIDLFKRRIIGWSISKHPDALLVKKALNHALESRGYPDGLVFHSDQGSQYSSRLFRQTLAMNGITQSMSNRGNCWDNAPMERVFRSLKSEWIPKRGYLSLEEATQDIGYYVMVYYNHYRPHSANAGIPPALAEKT
jgi:putative transposase